MAQPPDTPMEDPPAIALVRPPQEQISANELLELLYFVEHEELVRLRGQVAVFTAQQQLAEYKACLQKAYNLAEGDNIDTQSGLITRKK